LGSDHSHHPRVTQQANIGGNCGNGDGDSSKPRATTIDVSFIQFVEALAIADARRDHLAFSRRLPEQEAVDGIRTLRAGASHNDARRRLRKIFDRTPEREVDRRSN